MNDWPPFLLSGLIVLPLVAAIVTFLMPKCGRMLTMASVITLLVASASLAVHLYSGGDVHVRVGDIGAPLGIDLRLDGLSVLMLLSTAVVTLAVSLYAPHYFQSKTTSRFWPLLCFLLAALQALFCSADIFNLYVTLELLGFAAVLLVALSGDRAALAAAMRYLLVGLCGSLLYLMGVALVYGQTATLDLALIAERLPDGTTALAALCLMTTGLIIKAALFPMHFWLPSAHGHAPAPVSALLSALVVKAAFYILLRLWYQGLQSAASTTLAQMLGLLATMAILWGSLQAFRQTRLKLLVAYSTVAQLGYLFMALPLTIGQGVALGGKAYGGAMLILIGHAFAKTAMFLVAGNLLRAVGHDRIKDLAGQAQKMPISSFAFALAGLSLVGLPPSLGFAGKWMMLSAALEQQQWWWAAVLLLGGLLTAAYLLKVFVSVFRSMEPDSVDRAAGSGATVEPLPRLMEWVPLVIALLAAALGLQAHWPAVLANIGAPLTR